MRWLTLALSLLALAGSTRPGTGAVNPAYASFSLPLTVTGLPAEAESVPVRCSIDFTKLLQELGATGVVDEHSVRLFRLAPPNPPLEVPVQFSPFAQGRVRARKLLPDTPSSVSYSGEFRSGEEPPELRVAGELTWIAESSPGREYRLDFGVLRGGRVVQVPFEPQNLRTFDERGQGTPIPYFPLMQIHPQWPLEGVLHILERNQLVTSYRLGPKADPSRPDSIRRPFFYPLLGPDGISLTEFGKPHDPTGSHAHHYSLWIAHADVQGQDFWSEKGGLIVQDGLELLEDGPIFCRLVVKARWLADGKPLLYDRREFTFYRGATNARFIDVDLQLRPAGTNAVTFGKTSFGFLAARVAQSMTVFDGGGEILNASGGRNEAGAHLRRARWLDQSGPIAPGQWNGLAVFDHPENPNYPTGWHCRNDGWAGAAFNLDGPYRVGPENVLHLRYRLYLHRHDALQSNVEKRYNDYAARWTIQLGAAKSESSP